MKIFTMISAIFLSIAVYAGHAGEVAIVSHSGEQFYVILNGAYQNHHPSSNVNFQAYTNNWNNCRVIAANNHFSIDKHISVKPNRRVTYKIVNFHGFHKLQLVSEQPIYNSYGNNNCGTYTPPPVYQGNSCNNNTPPQCGNGGQYNPYGNNHPYGYPSGNNPQYTGGYYGHNSAMILSQQAYQRLRNAVKNETFASDQLRIAMRAAKNKRMTVAQIKGIARLFTFSNEQLKFAKAAYPNCLNQFDYYEVMEVFTFSSDKRKLEEFLANQ